MTLVAGPVWPLLALIWPLLLGATAALPSVRPHALRLLPLAPLPALAVALAGIGGATEVPDLLLGVVLLPVPAGLMLFGMTAGLWLAAGIAAQGLMAGTRNAALFAGFWCLTLAGNLGVFLAADVITFYVAFAAVSLAAWFLVIHDRSDKALRAGRVYIALAIAGEACLLAGFVIGVDAAGDLAIAAIRAALPEARFGGLAVGLLIAGFGLKAGLVPLHVWLPLAHPAAPVPASAVLSGAIVKAGLIGLIVFLPDGAGGSTLLVLGFVGAFAGAAIGLAQSGVKAVLAYSTISQMGLMLAVLGAAIDAGGTRDGVAFYALHHGLAKGALFLCIGLVAAGGAGWRRAVLAMAALIALSVAGAPLTGGALAKAAAKPALGPVAAELLTLSAIGTTLVLLWFFALLAKTPAARSVASPEARTAAAPFAATALVAVAAVSLPWLLWDRWSGLPPDYPWRTASLVDAIWPVAAAALFGALALWRGWRLPDMPPGDIIALGRLVPQPRGPDLPDRDALGRAGAPLAAGIGTRLMRAVEAVEAHLIAWRWTGGLLLALLLALVAATG